MKRAIKVCEKMKLFEERQIFEAYEFAAEGGQALHLFSDPGVYPGAPACFKKSRKAAHLFDRDKERLIDIAKSFGVRKIKVSHEGTKKQHIDLCGRPLRQAIKFAEGYKQYCIDAGVEISK